MSENPTGLVLDVDTVVAMISGWRADFWGTLPVARRLASAMARQHLSDGHDVVLPQLITAEAELAPFLAAVEDSGASYVEVVLLADTVTTTARLLERTQSDQGPVGRHVERVVMEAGGVGLLEKIRADLLAYLESRVHAIRIDTSTLTVGQVCAAARKAAGM